MRIIRAKYLVFLTSYLLLTACLLIGCSEDPTNYDSDEIAVQVKEDGIVIFNKLSTSIYYFAVEAELAGRINWAAVSKPENRIKSFNFKLIQFDEMGFKEDKDKKVIVYYWTTQDPAQEDIQSAVISINE